MPNTFVMRQSALQDGTVLRSPDTFAPGSDLHGTMAKANAVSVDSRTTNVIPSQSGVRSFATDVVNSQGMRGVKRTVEPMAAGSVRRKSSDVEPLGDSVKRQPNKVLPIDEGVRNG